MPKVLPLALCLVAFVSCIAQGQEAPAIFNGQDLSGWQATPDKMAAHWSVENGLLNGDKGKIGLQLHGGVHMKMQFRNIRIQELEKTGTASDTEPDAKKSSFEVTKPPAELEVDPFYKKYVSANGLPVLSSDKVNDYALKEAAFLVTEMLARRPDILKAMIKSGSRLCIIGHNEYTTDLPGWAHLKPKDYWDARARGMGGSRKDPLCSCAEENLLGFPGDPYSTESIFIHELAHNIHLRGVVNVDETFDARVKKAYDTAMAKELWSGKYASVNHHEYFAEGVQSWFDNNRAPDHDHNHVDTRRELVEYDAALADLCREVFGDTKLTYTKPATRLHGHMEGYDPSKAPAFKWPDRLKKAQAEIHRKATERSKRGQSPKKK